METRWRFLSTLLVTFLWASIAATQTRRGGVQPSSARDQAAALQNENVGGPFNSVCTAGTTFGSNVMANCDSVVLPHNETAIIVDPNDANHLAAGSNDTQLPPNGASGSARSALGYYTSFDGGKTWINGAVAGAGFAQASDPALGFDTQSNVFIGIVSFDLGIGGKALGGAIQVARSSDGGRTFGTPVNDVEVSTNDGIEEDKPYLVVDSNPASRFVNSVYVTWTRFHFDSLDNYLESPIFFRRRATVGRLGRHRRRSVGTIRRCAPSREPRCFLTGAARKTSSPRRSLRPMALSLSPLRMNRPSTTASSAINI